MTGSSMTVRFEINVLAGTDRPRVLPQSVSHDSPWNVDISLSLSDLSQRFDKRYEVLRSMEKF
jgi:hypothetical protein